MPRKASTQPNDVEMAILRALWDRGPSTVREVHAALAHDRDTGYTSTAKMIQVMCDKGLVRRNGSGRPQRFAAAAPEEQTQGHIVRQMIHKVFGGSARKLVMRAVQSQDLSADEVAEIRKLLKQIQDKKQQGT